MGKEFYVDTDKLKTVAQKIQDLLDTITSDDATPGTPANFQQASSIDAPTATFWSGPNALANAYSNEWKYVNDTYTQLVEQLGNVHTACTQTTSGYATHETDATHNVRSAPQM